MVRKFFALDKNYLLEQAQLELEDFLLKDLVDLVKREYEARQNPLGITDSYTLQIVIVSVLTIAVNVQLETWDHVLFYPGRVLRLLVVAELTVECVTFLGDYTETDK